MLSPAFFLYLDICWATISALKGEREKGTLHCLREISYVSGTFHSPNQSKQTYFHTFPKGSLISAVQM